MIISVKTVERRTIATIDNIIQFITLLQYNSFLQV